MAELYQLRVVLRDVSPLVWRRLLISSETSLAQFHELLLLAFAWNGEHLHLFHIHGRNYGVSQYGGIAFSEDARQVRLSRFRLHEGERFRYEYDFTAGWALDGCAVGADSALGCETRLAGMHGWKSGRAAGRLLRGHGLSGEDGLAPAARPGRSEEHTSGLQ